MPDISIVIPVFNEAESLAPLMARLLPVLEGLGAAWEVLFINDGSTDDSLAHLRALSADDSRMRVVSLSRNFGKEAALTAGLDYASGNAVIPMDADLQDPPEVIPALVEAWRGGVPVVLAVRRSRQADHWVEAHGARAFYALMRVLNVPMHQQTGDFRLMDRKVVDALRRLPERQRLMKGLFAWAGFRTVAVPYDRPARVAGQSKQGVLYLCHLVGLAVVSFSTLPLRLSLYLGGMVTLVATLYGLGLLFSGALAGQAALMVAICWFGGVQLMALGLLGSYVGHLQSEARQRPIYVVDEVLRAE